MGVTILGILLVGSTIVTRANKLGKSSVGSNHKRENRQNAFNKLINMDLVMHGRNQNYTSRIQEQTQPRGSWNGNSKISIEHKSRLPKEQKVTNERKKLSPDVVMVITKV